MTAEPPLRPEPPRRLGDTIQAWLAWFGLTRLIVSALCVAVVAAGVAWLVRAPAPSTEAGLPFASTTTVPEDPGTATAGATLPTPSTTPPTTGPTERAPILVHVAGAVAAPGVYQLWPDDRVHSAIDAAGGPSAAADLDGLNLADPIADGQRIYVPVAGEVDPATVPSGRPPAPGGAGGPSDDVSGPIDLNTASAAQLETLPGIGPATAAAIIDDRDRHGPFAAVDDLQRVPGIGPAKLAAIVDGVTV